MPLSITKMITRRLPRATLFFLYLVLLAAAYIASFSRSRFPNFNMDDLAIVFVYARNFILHKQFLWDVCCGVVDGFTSFLDLIIKIGLYIIAPEQLIGNSIRVSVVFGFFVPVSLLYAFRKELCSVRALFALIVLLALSIEWALISAAVIGLETTLYILFTFCSIIMAASLPSKSFSSYAFVGVLFFWNLVRPEALPLSFVLIFFLLRRSDIRAERHALRALLLFLSALGAYYLWRYLYFGSPFPNTYYAKKSSLMMNEISEGYDFLRRHLWKVRSLDIWGLIILTLILPLWATLWRDAETRRMTLYFGVLAVVSLILTLFSGGDTYVSHPRFIALPFCLLLGGLVPMSFGLKKWPCLVFVLPVSLLLFSLRAYELQKQFSYSALTRIPSYGTWFQEHWGCDRELGKILEKRYPGARIGHTDYQRLKYANDALTVIDLYGLNDVEIAHQDFEWKVLSGKFLYKNILEKKIDVMFIGFGFTSRSPKSQRQVEWIFKDFDRMVRHYRMYSDYSHRVLLLEHFKPMSVYACNRYYNFFVRKDYSPTDLIDNSHVGDLDKSRG